MSDHIGQIIVVPGPPAGTSECANAVCAIDHRAQAIRLHVTGELDLATADALARVAIGALGLPVRVLVVDLRAVTFCGAAGIGALVRIQRAGSESGIRLILTGVRPAVRRAIDLTGAAIPIVDA